MNKQGEKRNVYPESGEKFHEDEPVLTKVRC